MTANILSIGALSNGNLGDMYQADAIARLVRATNLDVSVTSASPSQRGSTYPTLEHKAASPGAVFDLNFVNSFDLVLVGGGGLLSADHRPLQEVEWVQGINIPIIGLSLGAAGEAAQSAAKFVQKCRFFSVRDEYSERAVSNLRNNVEIIMDPILLDSVKDGDEFEKQIRPDKPGGIAWVPGKLRPKTQKQWMEVMKNQFAGNRDSIYSFNPVTDKSSGFADSFSNIEYLDKIDTYIDGIKKSKFVVSERYHAVIYALTAGVPVVGVGFRSQVVYSKIAELLRRVGYPELMLFDTADMTRNKMRRLTETVDQNAVRKVLINEREKMINFLKHSINACLN